MNRRLARAFVVACVAAGAFAALTAPAASAASAATPCWKTLLNDWYDGHIDHIYPIPCYHQAIDHLPTDVQAYSNAAQDIERALAQAIAAQKNHTTTTTSTTTTTTSTSSSGGPTTTTPPPPTTTTTKRSPFSNAIRDITPGGADAFPLPLLILGLLAIVLVLAGIGGMVWRRYQSRGGTA